MISFVVFTVCLASVLAVPLESPEHVSGRIVNGSPAAKAQFPYQAFISLTNDRGNFVCSGAILNSLWVVTAGHCVVGAKNASIYVGSNSLSGNDANRFVATGAKFVLYEGYDDVSPANDIALIRLDRLLYFNTNIQPIAIARSNILDGATVVVSGWGTTSNKDTQPSTDLRFTSLSTISNTVCARTYGTKLISDDVICAVSSTTAAKGICAGDLGAPLVANPSSNPVLIGLGNFFSSKGCETSDPSGFTRVSSFAKWISSVTGI